MSTTTDTFVNGSGSAINFGGSTADTSETVATPHNYNASDATIPAGGGLVKFSSPGYSIWKIGGARSTVSVTVKCQITSITGPNIAGVAGWCQDVAGTYSQSPLGYVVAASASKVYVAYWDGSNFNVLATYTGQTTNGLLTVVFSAATAGAATGTITVTTPDGTTQSPVTATASTYSSTIGSGSTGIFLAGNSSSSGPYVASTYTSTDGGTPPALSLTPSAPSIYAAQVQPMTATLTGSSASLAASLSPNTGTLSTTSPTSGVPFNYTAPSTVTTVTTVTLTVTDSTDSLTQHSTITLNPGVTYTISPSSAPLGVLTHCTITGSGSDITSTTLATVTGGTNAFLSNQSVSGQTISFDLDPGTATGTLTIGNTADNGTVTITASSATITANVVCHGDSIMSGTNGSNGGAANATRLAVISSGLGPKCQIANQGYPGQTITAMIGEFAADIDALWDSGATYNILLASGGTNDIAQGASAATVESRIQSYYTTSQTNHPWIVVWGNLLPADGSSYPANFDPIRTTVNTWLNSTWISTGFHGLSCYGSDFRIGTSGSEQNATYFSTSDHTHPTDAGYTIIGGYDLSAIMLAIATGSFANGTAVVSSPGIIHSNTYRYIG